MSLIPLLCCVNCSQIYDETRKPCIGTCHDSVCQPCRQQMKVYTCPTCGKKDAFKEETVNWHGMPMQEAILRDLTEDTIEEFVKNQKDKNSGPCQECGDLAKKLRICLDCAAEQEILVFNGTSHFVNMAGVTYLGAFYRTKQFSICANCATDGEHSEHNCDLFANVYKEEEVDFELKLVLSRTLEQKYEKEMEEHKGSHRYYLYYYKRIALRVEHDRMRDLDYQLGVISRCRINESMNQFLMGMLKKVIQEESLYNRKIKTMYVEDIQRRLEASDDEEFKEEMRKLSGKILKEEEKLGVEELEKVNGLVKERILKHCEPGDFGVTGIDDYEKSLQELQNARATMMRRLDDFLRCIAANSFESTYLGERCFEISVGEDIENLYLQLSHGARAYYTAYANHTRCALAVLETQEIVKGRGMRLEHPNLMQYLCLFQLQDKFSEKRNDDVLSGNVLHFM